jgi:tRNA threonylcarbamoyladenosine biosynthesis protein TsaB
VTVATPQPRVLIIETSDRVGQVATAAGPTLLQVRTLPEARRHARDLAPAVAEVLAAQGWRPRDVDAVVVSRGPGSYTGLRVGIMSAKTFAHATGCRLLGIDTFLAVASQTPANLPCVDVLADAQQDKVYFQPFARSGETWSPTAALLVCPFADWLLARDPAAAVTGPGLAKWLDRLPPEIVRLAPDAWHPTPASLVRLGMGRLANGDKDDPLSMEPIYLRPSAAEEQWQGRGPRTAP